MHSLGAWHSAMDNLFVFSGQDLEKAKGASLSLSPVLLSGSQETLVVDGQLNPKVSGSLSVLLPWVHSQSF